MFFSIICCHMLHKACIGHAAIMQSKYWQSNNFSATVFRETHYIGYLNFIMQETLDQSVGYNWFPLIIEDND